MQEAKKQNNSIKIIVLLSLVSAVFLIFQFTSLEFSDFTPERIKQFILGFGFWAPLVFLVIYTLRSVILVIPVLILSLTAGLAFGPIWGGLINIIGGVFGSVMSFFFARFFGKNLLEQIPMMNSGPIDKFGSRLEKNGFKVLFVIRLIGIPPYDVVNFGSGLSKVKFKDYLFASILGMIPGGLILPFIGSNLENIRSPKFILSILLFILLLFVPKIYKKFKIRNDPTG